MEPTSNGEAMKLIIEMDDNLNLRITTEGKIRPRAVGDVRGEAVTLRPYQLALVEWARKQQETKHEATDDKTTATKPVGDGVQRD